MKISWFAHATFLVQGDGLRIITDPYNPEEMGFQHINADADIVIRCSALDRGHNYAEMVGGNPAVVTATEVSEDGITVKGLRIRAVQTQESLIHKTEPDDNGMYCFTLEGIRIAHLGDVGNRITDEQLAALGENDVWIVPTGGPPTIDLDDLMDAIAVAKPRVVIPGHFRIPGTESWMLPPTAFTDKFDHANVTWVDSSEVEFRKDALPAGPQVYVLQASSA